MVLCFVDRVNRSRELVPRLFASGFTGTARIFENPMTPSLARHDPIVIQFSQ